MARAFDATTQVGDDCTHIETPGGFLAVSADVGPSPMIMKLPGHENDFEAAGWLAAVATISDIAAAAAQPHFLTNCIDAPPDFKVTDFRDYLSGYFKACAAFGFKNGGGDIRHGEKLAMRVFGAGVSISPTLITRKGAKRGDRLVVIGSAGSVIGAYLDAKSRRVAPEQWPEFLRFPHPQVREMALLGPIDVISAASDTSDGLLGAVENILTASRCGAELRLDQALIPQTLKSTAESECVDPWNLFFCWGDWSIAATVKSKTFDQFLACCAENHIRWTELGIITSQEGIVSAHVDGQKASQMTMLRNENFREQGYNAGVDSHLDYMLRMPLFAPSDC